MGVILHIVYFKLRSFLKLNAGWNPATVVKHIGSVIVFGGFAVGAYLFAHSTTSYLLEKTHIGLFLLHRFLSMLLFVFFLSINVGNIIVSYASFYRSQETLYFF